MPGGTRWLKAASLSMPLRENSRRIRNTEGHGLHLKAAYVAIAIITNRIRMTTNTRFKRYLVELAPVMAYLTSGALHDVDEEPEFFTDGETTQARMALI